MRDHQPLVQVRNVTVQFEDRLVLDSVSLEVFAGEILCILGESGIRRSFFWMNPPLDWIR